MSARRIIDPHQHFWRFGGSHGYPWLEHRAPEPGMLGDLAPIASGYGPAEYRRDAAGYDLVGSVHIEAVASDGLAETDWLNSLGDALPSAIVARVALDAPDVAAALEAQASRARVRGIRHIVNWNPDPYYSFTPHDLLEDDAWRRGFGLLARYGLSFDLQLYPAQMPAAARLAAAHPQTLIIVNHTGMPLERSAEGLALWRAGIAVLAACDNVAIKLSGLGMLDHGWTLERIRPFLREAIEAFGPQRCMFASNFPVDRLYSSFARLYGAFEAIVADLGAEEQDLLFRGTAARLYRLQPWT